MRIGLLLPGFSASEQDWAIPVQLNLVREMAARHDVRVIALRYPHTRQPYKIYGSRVFPLGAGQVRGAGRVRLWGQALRLLLKLHQEEPFDVLHAMWADETGLIAVWAGRMLNVPTVVSVAGGELVGLHDAAYGLQRSDFSRWIVGQALTADRVVVTCRYMQRLAEQIGYVPSEKLRRVVLGADTELFRPVQMRRRENHLVHAGSLIKVKDQATLLRAVVRLPQVTLDVIGQGPEEPSLRRLAYKLGIAERVSFAGQCAYPDMPERFQNAALHVFPSLHEGQGMVTLEASACGTPTVGTAVGLLPDDLRLGTAVAVGDDAALAHEIAELLEDKPRLDRLRVSAREAVETQYTIGHTAENLLRIYGELSKY